MKHFAPRFSYFRKQLWMVIGVNFLSLLVAGIFLFSSFVTDYQDNLVDVTNTKLSMLSASSTSALLFNDNLAAETVLASLSQSPGTRFAKIYDAQMQTFAEFNRDAQADAVNPDTLQLGVTFNDDNLYIFRPISLDNETLGYILISADTDSLHHQQIRYAKIFVVVFAISLLIAYALNWRLQTLLSAPINKLVDLVTQVARDRNYQHRIEVTHKDEIGVLSHGVNGMLDTIEEHKRQLQENSNRLESLVALRTEQLFQRANYDALTQLPNRHLLIDRLDHGIDNALRENSKIALMFLDLDRFKVINDSLGHTIGDLLLKQVAKNLGELVESVDSVCRWGGDEFVILVEHVEEQTHVESLAQQIISHLSVPMDISGHQLHISTSIGIALFPRDGVDSTTLLKHADISMYRAKDRGPGQFCFFDGTMLDDSINRLSMESMLRQAIEEQQFHLVYQPQICLNTDTICGFEALIRWSHEGELIPPSEFLPVVEEIGALNNLSVWVINQACRQNAQWVKSGLIEAPVAVNLPASFIVLPNCAELIEKSLVESGLAPQLFEIEITENTFVASTEGTIHTLERLKSIGVSIAIDDFGTGYSCMSYLRDLPVSRLKIDGSFIQILGENEANDGIVKSIITLGKSLQLMTVGECIETEVQKALLRDLGCDLGQGYFHSKPLSGKDVENFVQSATVGKS